MESPLNILIVDDEPDLLDTMSVILEMEGFGVSVATEGQQALNVIAGRDAAHAIDILITDIEMPGLAGRELIDRLRTVSDPLQSPAIGDAVADDMRSIGVIVITAYGTKALLAELLKKGIDDYIDKPFKMDDLVARVRTLEQRIRHARHQREDEARALSVRDVRLQLLQERLTVSEEYRILGKLAGGIAHDFNNMLCSVLGLSQMAQQSLRTSTPETASDAVSGYLDLISAAARQAQHTVSQLMAFAKQDEGRLAPLDIHQLIKEAAIMTQGVIGRNITIKYDLVAPRHTITADRTMLSNAFVNLILNARDAMPHGGMLTFHSSVVPLEDEPGQGTCNQIVVSVVDTGIGMSEEVKRKAFEPFFTTKGKTGNGLGLPSVLSTITSHGGTIEVHSQLGVGTEFKITFPLLRTVEEIGVQ